MSPEIMNVFKLWDETYYHLRHTAQFLIDPKHNVFNVSESASYLCPKIWEQIPIVIKDKNSLVGSKKEIRKWKTLICASRIFKNFIDNLGFV